MIEILWMCIDALNVRRNNTDESFAQLLFLMGYPQADIDNQMKKIAANRAAKARIQ